MDRLTAAQVFVDVARSGSFTSTADRLDMSRPMVTRYVEEMERWFGVRLFHRTTRKVNLTTIGEQCLKDVEPWLETGQQLVSSIKSSDELTDSIRIATAMSLGHSQLIRPVCLFMENHPKVTIDIDLEDTTINLVDSRIDLAIRIASNPDNSLIGKPIAICRSVLVASPTYLKTIAAITQPEDLSDLQCLGYANFERQVWHLTRLNEHKSIHVNCRLTANEATILLEAAILNAGISIQPSYLANAEINKGNLVEVLPEWDANEMNIYALYSSRKFLSPTVRALIDFLEDYFKRHPWEKV